MMKNLVALGLFFVVICSTSCDPQFDYKFSGIVTCGNVPIENVKIKYKFLPDEKTKNWRANIQDSVVVTDIDGKFIIRQSTVTFTLDGLQLTVIGDRFHKEIILSKSEKWRKSFGMNKKEFIYDFGDISLVKYDR